MADPPEIDDRDDRETFHITIEPNCPVVLFCAISDGITAKWPDAVMADTKPGATFAIKMRVYREDDLEDEDS